MTDDELLDQLRSRDPAASLPPAPPAQVDRLLEDAMSHDVETRHTTGPEGDPRRRTPLTWLVAAAAVLVIAGVGAFALVGGDLFGGDDEPTATSPGTSQTTGSTPGQTTGATEPTEPTEPTVLELSAQPPTTAKCAAVSPELLGLQETAFDGTVTSMTDGVVTLEVGQWYRGGDTDLVTVQAPPAEMTALIAAVQFEQGQRYLVAANDGFVTACAMSAPWSEELAALYAAAYGA